MTELAFQPGGRAEPSPAAQIARDFLDGYRKLLAGLDVPALIRVVELLRAARDRGATIYIAGNGGSAATASHLVNDLCKATRPSGCRAVKAVCLSDNVSWLTALANDEGYERVFSGQLENLVQRGDLLIVISASGNSPNLIEAVDVADARGLVTIALLGFDGGALKGRVDEPIWLESELGAYGPVESAHSLLCHVLTACLVNDRPAVPAGLGR